VTAAPLEQLSARELIVAFAEVIGTLGASTQVVGGSIGFILTGDEGGRWRVDLDTPGGVWTEWTDEQPASTTITTSAATLFGLLIEARATAAFLVEGDRQKLWRLSELLSASGSPLTQRHRPNGKSHVSPSVSGGSS